MTDQSATLGSIPQRDIHTDPLDCGIQFLAEPMPGYHTATAMVRVTGGLVSEPEHSLGLAYLLEQTIDKGTEKHNARDLANAFDALGAHYAVHTGLESWVFVVSALPEFLAQAIELLGEMICQPAFPAPIVETAVALTQQELVALEDSAQAVLRREMSRQAYGPTLGRHRLGTHETLARIDGDLLAQHWRSMLSQSAVTVTAAGQFDVAQLRTTLDGVLASIPAADAFSAAQDHQFKNVRSHLSKDLEQTQIGVSFPGVAYADPDYYVEKAIIEVLSGGMGARLFTEVREKQGLVYWVGAWNEHPRKMGMIHIGAATTYERCPQTLRTLLREVDRLSEDLSDEELNRAKVGMLAERTTTGASVHQRAGELISDYFQLGHAVLPSERITRIKAVTVADVKRYLRTHSREDLSIVTIGPKPIEMEELR